MKGSEGMMGLPKDPSLFSSKACQMALPNCSIFPSWDLCPLCAINAQSPFPLHARLLFLLFDLMGSQIGHNVFFFFFAFSPFFLSTFSLSLFCFLFFSFFCCSFYFLMLFFFFIFYSLYIYIYIYILFFWDLEQN